MWRNDLPYLFPIRSQTPEFDRAWLARLFEFTREQNPTYRYLEIGSYLGGSLTPALLDERCAQILSIDSRPSVLPDARSASYDYSNVTTATMLESLKAGGLNDLSKLKTFEGSASQYDFQNEKYHLAFIDAEHTDEAVFADFLSIFNHLEPRAACVFHDTQLITTGLENILAFLRYQKRNHTFAVFRDSWTSALFLDRKGEDLPEQFRASAANWSKFKSKSRDELLLHALKNRCTFTLKPKPVLPI
jgi:hypothetical protein